MRKRRLEIQVGARVETTDGHIGHIHWVIFNPSRSHVSGLVVRAELVPPRDLAIPVELIADVTDECVILRIPSSQLFREPAFNPSQFSPVLVEKHGYQDGEALISISHAMRG